MKSSCYSTYLKKFEGHIEAFQFPQQVHGTILNTHHKQHLQAERNGRVNTRGIPLQRMQFSHFYMGLMVFRGGNELPTYVNGLLLHRFSQ